MAFHDTEGTREGDFPTCRSCGDTYHADEIKWFEDKDGDNQCEWCHEAAAEYERDAQQKSDVDWLTDTAIEQDTFGTTVGGSS